MNELKHDIIVFKEGNVMIDVEVSPSEDTVWLTQEQIGELFEVDRTSILRHINNIYKSEELDVESTCAEIAHMGSLNVQEYIKKQYNLEMITSIGYRVNSKRGVAFRRWANKVLKEYLLKGYTINQNRLMMDKINYRQFNETVKMIADMVYRKELTNEESKGPLEVIAKYAYALDTLDKYDHQTLTISNITKDNKQVKLEYEDAINEIKKMPSYGKNTLFGREKDNSFHGALNAIYQSVGGEDAYPSVEEKAANLLYFIVKDHAFIDGNKRIAASIFLWFLDINKVLQKNNGTRIVEDNALVAMVMMIALSKPEEKTSIIKILINLINQNN